MPAGREGGRERKGVREEGRKGEEERKGGGRVGGRAKERGRERGREDERREMASVKHFMIVRILIIQNWFDQSIHVHVHVI